MESYFPFICAFLILMAIPVGAIAPRDEYVPMPEISMGNTLRPISSIVVERDTLHASDFEGLKYETLIKCLAWYESSWRTNVFGDSGRAFGVLQFHRATFDAYCEGDYDSSIDQMKCADKMLSDDFDNIFHWTTNGYCL